MEFKEQLLKATKSTTIFALAFLVMVCGIYPNYNIIEFDSTKNICLLSSVAHHFIWQVITASIVATAAGAISYIFIPEDKDILKKDKFTKISYVTAFLFLMISLIANFFAVVGMADFFDHSSQPSISRMSQPLDHYECK
ncbi:MAG: hypothetical protein ABF759_10445 [Acetobacter malorum]|uniref:hypothetical protein n=1 Tax=Acetobacteraceae TaxID=433 RepID=UPI0039EBDD2A